MKRRVAALVGPTAVGKSAIAVEVATGLGAEIVSVDSMQVYREMDAGTAKPSSAMRAAVPHHLVDICSCAHALTAAEYQRYARASIEDISGRSAVPLLVGGSGLYFRAVVDELRFPPRAAEDRAALEEEAQRDGPEALHRRLTGLDPDAASRIDPRNTRRLVRALEVVGAQGRFERDPAWDRYESIYDLRVAGLTRPRADLYERVTERVDEMLAGGLIDEARRLRGELSPTARQALGYRQVLEAGNAPPEELRDRIVTATKRYVRREGSLFPAGP